MNSEDNSSEIQNFLQEILGEEGMDVVEYLKKFRCTKCNSKYRRIPLSGKCRKCNTKLVLTVHKGSVKKYLKITKFLINNYNLDEYIKQRVRLLEISIESVFEKDNVKQVSLSNFLE